MGVVAQLSTQATDCDCAWNVLMLLCSVQIKHDNLIHTLDTLCFADQQHIYKR